MNTMYKRSFFTMVLFGILFIYICLSFAIIGPENYLNSKNFILIHSIIIGLVLIGFVIMLIKTKNGKSITDERDILLQKQATVSGMILTSIFVFVIAIILYETNRENGYVNVSWLWVIAYGTFSFSYFVTSAVLIYLYKKNE